MGQTAIRMRAQPQALIATCRPLASSLPVRCLHCSPAWRCMRQLSPLAHALQFARDLSNWMHAGLYVDHTREHQQWLSISDIVEPHVNTEHRLSLIVHITLPTRGSLGFHEGNCSHVPLYASKSSSCLNDCLTAAAAACLAAAARSLSEPPAAFAWAAASAAAVAAAVFAPLR